MDPRKKKILGSTGLAVTRLGLGCASLGRLEGEEAQEQATQVVQRALSLGLNLFDTAPLCGTYNSGILAKAGQADATYNYREPPPEIAARAQAMQAVAESHGVDLKAAASQFALAHPAVTCIIPGTRFPERVEENFRMIEAKIPAAFWAELKEEGLIRRDAPAPGES